MMLKALLWKDSRQHGKFLAACGVVFLIPYVIALVALMVNRLSEYPVEPWFRFFGFASIANASLAIVLVAFIAGNAIAGERADRSAEFTAYLPIDRKTAVLSKVVTTLGICVGLLAVMSFIAWILTPSEGPGAPDMSLDVTVLFLSAAISMFGVAWLFSSFVRTPTIAAAMGVAFPVCFGLICAFLHDLKSMQKTDIGMVFLAVSLAVGLSCFVAGIVHYLRRVEP